jgi:hypothetical protein
VSARVGGLPLVYVSPKHDRSGMRSSQGRAGSLRVRTALGGRCHGWQQVRPSLWAASRRPLPDGHCRWPAAGLHGLNLGEFTSVPALASIVIGPRTAKDSSGMTAVDCWLGHVGGMAGEDQGGSELVATVAAPIAAELSYLAR